MKHRTELCRLFFIFIFLANGCAVTTHSDCPYDMGNFTGQWYDYYYRACFCIDRGNYRAAISDLRQAIMRRPKEKQWANTYGMHFSPYFPHRETGISYYFMGDDENAMKELGISIFQEPSEKAYHYLDKVRTRIMEREKCETGRPLLKIITPHQRAGNEFQTKENPVIISGVAEDRRYVSEITLSGNPLFIETSGQQVKFREELKLNEGRHEIDLTARNLIGGETKKRLVLHVDRSGPMIVITESDQGTGLRGYVRDKTGIKSLTMEAEGKTYDIPIEKNEFFIIPLSSDFILRATDTLGNETETDMAGMLAKSPYQMFAQSNNVMTDAGTPREPRIILKDKTEQEVLFGQQIIGIQGQIRGGSHVRELVFSVENESYYETEYETDEKGYFLSFHQTLCLNMGKNIVTIRAKDEAGNIAVKKKIVICKISEVLRPLHRYSLRLHPFDNLFFFRFLNEKKEARFQYFLMTNLISQQRFRIAKDETLQSLFDKNNLRIPENKDLRPCDSLLLGSTDRDRNGIEIIARMVDTRTSEILATKDVYSEDQDDSALNSLAQRLSEKFRRAFPLQEGMITAIENDDVFADLGAETIREGWSLIVYREASPGSDSEIITDALKGKEKRILIGGPAGIRTGDKVITR